MEREGTGGLQSCSASKIIFLGAPNGSNNLLFRTLSKTSRLDCIEDIKPSTSIYLSLHTLSINVYIHLSVLVCLSIYLPPSPPLHISRQKRILKRSLVNLQVSSVNNNNFPNSFITKHAALFLRALHLLATPRSSFTAVSDCEEWTCPVLCMCHTWKSSPSIFNLYIDSPLRIGSNKIHETDRRDFCVIHMF